MTTTSDTKSLRPSPLNLETINLLVEHQLGEWPDAAVRYHDLGRTQRKPLDIGDLPFALQLNPARMVSTAADTSTEAIASRPCFLCADNRPKEQMCAEWMPGWDLCVNPFEHHSIYARKLAEQGDLLTHDKDASAWHLMDMQALIETNFVIVRQGDRLRDLVEAIQNSRRNLFPVLSEDDKFLGVIALDDVRKIIFRSDLYDTVDVVDLMHPISEGDMVRSSDTLSDVVEKFKIGDRYNLVVVDDEDRYLGFLSRANTFSAYRRFISDTSDE